MPMNSLTDLYVAELKDLYSAENQIVKALPKMIKAATHPDLKKAFTDHLEQTKRHVERLVQVCDDMGVSPKGKKCNGMEGIIKEGAELIAEKPEPDVLDAGLAAAAQHVEHYEMAGYGTVRTWAEQLGNDKHAKLFQQTLDEERKADELLTQIAEGALNVDAEVDASANDGPADVAPKGKTAAKDTSSPKKTSRNADLR